MDQMDRKVTVKGKGISHDSDGRYCFLFLGVGDYKMTGSSGGAQERAWKKGVQ